LPDARYRVQLDAGYEVLGLHGRPPEIGARSLGVQTILSPAVYPYRFFAELGGLLSYGNDQLDNFRRAASYADSTSSLSIGLLRGLPSRDGPGSWP
jgi:hypothetical protein